MIDHSFQNAALKTLGSCFHGMEFLTSDSQGSLETGNICGEAHLLMC
jgi:hypothetical protein